MTQAPPESRCTNGHRIVWDADGKTFRTYRVSGELVSIVKLRNRSFDQVRFCTLCGGLISLPA